MKKLLSLSLISFIALSNIAQSNEGPITAADRASTTGAGLAISYIVSPGAGTVAYFALQLAETMGALATLGGGATSVATSDPEIGKKEIANQIKADIQEYNLNGELSPMLGNILEAIQKANSELSTEEILIDLETNL